MFNFKLPLLDRPILWYGFLFAFGFFVGYLVLTYLLRRYFVLRKEFRQEDVMSWPDFIKVLAVQRMDAGKSIFINLDKSMQRWSQNWRVGLEIPGVAKTAIIDAMNRVLIDSKISFQTPLTRLSQRLCVFTAKHSADVLIVQKRLQIESELNPILAPLRVRVSKVAEQITFYVIIGAIVGSRLGDVIFYQNWQEILLNPSMIFAVWQGGLASHGGAIGILIAVWVFAKRTKLPFWTAVDFTVIPTAIAGVFIRIGNFFNQEILGKATALPWGIVFLHPADGGPIVPRHPAQLYEAAWYFCSFLLLLLFWHRRAPFEPKGRLTGLFLILVFGFRFFIEFLKVEQSIYLSPSSFLTMGQWLSLPLIFLGFGLFFRRKS